MTAPHATGRDAPALLSARDLHVTFDGRHGRVNAVRGVSLQVKAGEVLAVVGESGSGKSTLARALMGMVAVHQGTLSLEGEPVALTASDRSLTQRRRVGMVFQDNGAAFNPRFTVERILREPLELLARDSNSVRGTPASAATTALLDAVGLSPTVLPRRPHELSGGQRQRVGIARALAGEPQLLICDEAVSALDVSVQAQILNLLVDLQRERGLALLFITHDLSVVSYIADRVAVMYRGEVLEAGDVHQIIDQPAHAYTRRLLAAGL
ncbi:dipeptide/oligopeptide/nickel ABC transporter ATP-binding protein [Variovorax sp. J22G21]|uniref:ABC transporter ATP-binding protein n=1 Tax=Variovorax fucosicus TaxID=3053517 RepID=UPI002575F207|nr:MULTISPECIES: dipeptide/oligopeptide/nickel ABC transporter ATP-binding protein [unclassified Variovorax]MDM0041308.1 dipeptide/oligopeptide/nickel ABC transporter ATP-binding protein [Variovorax sp. J22R193]MDM0057672.1 dipeptide/oligopeptide/nickel ABC transporter ATP-binding protein [Variovorax sp. J22G47]MDM0060365.1 dipeptide/oligopeptide/nickel ABC transporter ATP-binding protein [Variovorax sp. J22G21]